MVDGFYNFEHIYSNLNLQTTPPKAAKKSYNCSTNVPNHGYKIHKYLRDYKL